MTRLIATISVLLLVIVSKADETGSLQVRTFDGQTVAVDGAGVKATVFVFVTKDCPIANAYQPRLRELQKRFGSDGIQFVEVYPVASITKEAVEQHRRDFEIQAQSVLDAERTLAKKLGATVTPQAIVVDRQGQVLYRGRIDDQHAALGKKRPEPTQHDLADALKAISSGAPTSLKETQAVGCIIRF